MDKVAMRLAQAFLSLARKKSLLIQFTLIVTLALLLAACGSPADDEAAPDPGPVADDTPDEDDAAAAPEDDVPDEDPGGPAETVTVGVDPSTLTEAVFHFMERFCTENGYDIEVEAVWVGPRYFDRVILVSQQDLDVGIGGYATIPRIVEEGLEVVTIAGVNLATSDLIVRSEVEVNDWEDLLGLRIGAATGGLGEHQILAGLTERGMDPGEVEFELMFPGPQATVALVRGELDAIAGWEPWPSDMVTQGLGYIPFDYQETDIGPISGVVQTHPDMVGEPKIEAFLACFVEASEYLTNNPEEHIDEVIEWSGVSHAVATHAVQRFVYDPKLWMENLQYYAAFMFEQDLTETDTSGDLDVPQYVDFSVLEAATGLDRDELGYTGRAVTSEVVPPRHPSIYEYGPPPEED